MRKNFVLDTNVLLHDAEAITAFADNNVVIPIYVLEEVDTFKKDVSELGRNARRVSRNLDRLRELQDHVRSNGPLCGFALQTDCWVQGSCHCAAHRSLSTPCPMRIAS